MAIVVTTIVRQVQIVASSCMGFPITYLRNGLGHLVCLKPFSWRAVVLLLFRSPSLLELLFFLIPLLKREWHRKHRLDLLQALVMGNSTLLLLLLYHLQVKCTKGALEVHQCILCIALALVHQLKGNSISALGTTNTLCSVR